MIDKAMSVLESRLFAAKPAINNDFYHDLKQQWLTSGNHPITLLRAEHAVRTPWLVEKLCQLLPPEREILDVGCGAGLLSGALSQAGHNVTGIDLSSTTLDIARASDATGRVRYIEASAYALPFADRSFDVVCAMDVLEHVDEPQRLIAEAARVLKRGGLFFFHTFNRNVLSGLLVIKACEWLVPNTPLNLHVYHLFIKPSELTSMCAAVGLQVAECCGFEPRILSIAFLRMVLTRQISETFPFAFTRHTTTGYCGFARLCSASATP